MKKVFLTFLFIAAVFTCWADEYYLVGDATPYGWVTGDARKPTQMTETSRAGVYEWTGFLKHAEGFFICNSLSGWNGYGSSVPKAEGSFTIEGVGEDECTETDNKWNPTNTDWQLFTITLDTNPTPFKVSWKADDSFAADDEGFYNIGSAKDLYLFSVLVNANQSAKARLIADIDYTNYPQGFIGTNSKRFAGTFDGQEHAVTIALKNTATCTGLFGVINGATIKNLVVGGSAESSSKLIGGLGGVSYGNSTIENIVIKTNLKYTGTGDATCGGIFGDMEASSIVKNCAFFGSFQSAEGSNIRGLVSWCSGGIKFENCLIAPVEIDAAGFDNDKLANGSFSTTNCFKVDLTDTRLASGELCYLLNGDQSNIGWYQTIGSDNVPVPFSSRLQVYANGELKCDGTSAGGALVYSNSNQSTIPPHTDLALDGRCDVCNKLIPTHLPQDDEGFYEIFYGADLKWFADFVKEENQSAKAKLTADIDYTAYPQGFIGIDNAFSGVFDGQQHTIKVNLQNDAKIRGLFARISGATIKNLVIAGSVTSDFNNIGGLGGQADGSNTVENVVVKATINFTPGDGDASIGGFFPYINSGSIAFKNCAFFGSLKAGTSVGNAGLVSWSSGNCQAETCLIAPVKIEANAFDDYARGGKTVNDCYSVADDDARLASGELCYLLNGSTCFNPVWTQNIGRENRPMPFNTQGIVNYISSAGYATQYIPSTDVAIPANVEAYAGQIRGEYLQLTQIEVAISKDDAVILKGDEGFYNFAPVIEAHPAAQNDLKGAAADIDAAGKYVLAKPADEPVGFYLATSGTIKAGKAYLESASGVKAFIFDADNATSVQTIQAIHHESPVYNLAGQRVNKSSKGVFIQNGCKYVK
jgi:hypothetical protein